VIHFDCTTFTTICVDTLQTDCSPWKRNSDEKLPNIVLILQHHPVYTLGKRGKQDDILVRLDEVARRGVDVETSDRGGEVTYHGPGQLVAYPIVDLRRVRMGARKYVEALEDAVIDTVKSYGLQAHGRVPSATGVWVEDRKVAAIGVRISRGITTHGLALNVNTDLSMFSNIIPCGLRDKVC